MSRATTRRLCFCSVCQAAGGILQTEQNIRRHLQRDETLRQELLNEERLDEERPREGSSSEGPPRHKSPFSHIPRPTLHSPMVSTDRSCSAIPISSMTISQDHLIYQMYLNPTHPSQGRPHWIMVRTNLTLALIREVSELSRSM